MKLPECFVTVLPLKCLLPMTNSSLVHLHTDHEGLDIDNYSKEKLKFVQSLITASSYFLV